MKIIYVCLTLALILLSPVSALAHAVLVQSSPAAKGIVAPSPFAAELHFSSRIDAAHSRLAVVSATGKQLALVNETQSTANSLRSRPVTLPAGSYQLHWQVLSSDGHITRGDIPFRVSATR